VVRRAAYGLMSQAMAMAKKKQHDVFTAPPAGEDGHERALALWRAMEAAPSKRAAALLDLAELL
jgi:hypothetical protein